MLYDKGFYGQIGYPVKWLKDAEKYDEGDSYVIYDPSWEDQIPEIPHVSLYELFKMSALRNPEETAIIFLDRSITYREFDLMINKFASLLLDLGVKKGDFVSPMLPPSPQHWIAFFAALRIGAISSPLNVMYKEQEIAYQIKDCGAKTVVTLDIFYPYFAKLKDELKIKNIVVTNMRDFASPDFQPYESLKPYWDHPKKGIDGTVDFVEAVEKYPPADVRVSCNHGEDVAKIIYTSGTTGKSKGALETHLNLVFNTITHAHLYKSERKPVNYAVLPMNHTGGYMPFQLPTFYLGGTVIPRPIFDVEDALNVIHTQKVSLVFGPPTFYTALLRHSRFKDYDLSSLSLTAAGAAPVPLALVREWGEKVGTPLCLGWGGTETNTMGTFSMLKNKRKQSSVGVPFIGELKIINDKGSVVPRGQVGEILFRGIQVSKGYWNKPEETRAAFQEDGWFRTGDAGYIDEEGFLNFVDRIKDLIIASGYNIAPVEVESLIYQHPAVQEVGVVGVFNEYRGETVKAFIVLKGEFKGKVSEQDIINFCKERIAAFKVPTTIQFIDVMPKNAMGKTLRRILRDMDH